MSMLQGWTRRHFLQAAGLTLAAHQARTAHALAGQTSPTHAYVARQQDDESGSLHVLQSRGTAWQPIQSVDSVAPSAVLLNAAADVLFVANARDQFEGLPTSSVESYRVDSRTGKIALIGRRRLGLATVMPHALALSPDGSLLIIAAANGMYNLLPVAGDGSIGEVTAVRKELAFSTDSASAQMLFVDAHHVEVQDQSGVRLYRCDRDGMQLLGSTTSSASTRAWTVTAFLLSGQRAIAFASHL
jgi:6-phosphogluconolactonase (cycloisomerase 2 family)